MSETALRPFLRLTQALSDAQRVRILHLLPGRELCVCQIVEVLDLAPSTVSKHLSLLRAAGLVDCRKEGRWAFYFLEEQVLAGREKPLWHWVRTTLARDAQLAADRRKLNQVLKTDTEALCRRQRRS